jgi:PAS domain S-box-containing protein
MARKPTYEELEQRVKELEKEAVQYKQTKDALRLFSHSVDSSIDGIAMANTEGRITYVNETFAKMFGYSRQELTGKEIASIYSENQIPNLQKALKATMGGSWTGELIGKKKDGELFPVAVSSSRVLDGEENVIAQMASHRDITECNQAEHDLRESEHKYKTLTENSLTGIYIRQGEKFVFVNDRFAKIHGYKTHELLGKDYLSLIHPDHIELVRQTGLKRLKGEPAPKRYEVKRLRKDGKIPP